MQQQTPPLQSNLVSIMMPAYNAERYIGEAIDSVLAQTFADWELVVINDGSSDRTREIVSAYTDARIRLIDQPNGGEAAARNTALGHMRGEFVAFLDADDLYEPQHLETAISYLTQHPEHDGVYTDGYYIGADGVRLNSLSSRRRGPYTGHIFAEVVYGSDLFGPPLCVVLRREPILHHNLRYDTNIVIGPDWVFFMDYAESGTFGYVDAFTCLYRIHDTNITLRVDRRQRGLQLARCRLHAVELERFATCPLDVRTNVFYDLLVNLLSDQPEEQAAVTQMPQFRALPADAQGRLLRLTASQEVLNGRGADEHVGSWLQQARALDPSDWKGMLLSTLYDLSPSLCRRLLLAKRPQGDFDPIAEPFANIGAATDH